MLACQIQVTSVWPQDGHQEVLLDSKDYETLGGFIKGAGGVFSSTRFSPSKMLYLFSADPKAVSIYDTTF